MTTHVLLAATLLLTWPATAQTPTKAAKPAAAATPRTLLKGTWQATDDKNALLIITDRQYIERYAGSPEQVRALRVLDHACDAAPTAKPDGSLYLHATAPDPADNTCYYVVSVGAKSLELSPVGGRGNTLRFRRVAQSLGKQQGMP